VRSEEGQGSEFRFSVLLKPPSISYFSHENWILSDPEINEEIKEEEVFEKLNTHNLITQQRTAYTHTDARLNSSDVPPVHFASVEFALPEVLVIDDCFFNIQAFEIMTESFLVARVD